MESRYRWRFAEKKCPECQKEAIRKAKSDKGGGWYCWAKIGGCGRQFLKSEKRIEEQVVGRVPNEDVADQRNTVRKMAFKRALVATAKVSFGVSSLFTQDVEEMNGHHEEASQPTRPEFDPRPAEMPPEPAPPPPPAKYLKSVEDQIQVIRNAVKLRMHVVQDQRHLSDQEAQAFVGQTCFDAIGKAKPETLDDWAALNAAMLKVVQAIPLKAGESL